MNIINDLLLVNKEVLGKTRQTITRNWEVLLMGVVYAVMSLVAGMLVSSLLRGLGIIAGIIYALVESAIISSYLFVLHNVILYNRFRWKDIQHGLTYFIRKVYGVLFIFYLASLILNFLSGILGTFVVLVTFLLGIAALVLFNPLPEALYIKEMDSLQSVMYCIDFLKENWLNWLVPNGIVIAALYMTTGRIMSSGLNPFRQITVGFGTGTLVSMVVGSIILSLFMVYRGHLFKLLSTSTLRKRMFMRKL